MKRQLQGKVMTARGPVDAKCLGAVLMHEHSYSNLFATEEAPTAPEHADFAKKYFVPFFKELHNVGCHAFVEATPIPMRAWPDVYLTLSEYADIHIILSTGFYREAEPTAPYFPAKGVEHRWVYYRAKREPVEDVAQIMIDEFEKGIHGYAVRPGAIKLASSLKEMTPLERLCFEAGAIAQRATGLHITTHAVTSDAFETQFDVLTRHEVVPDRIVFGHTGSALVKNFDRVCQCMKEGATFLPTNLEVPDPQKEHPFYQSLVEAIRRVFDLGLGNRLVLGMDWAYCNERGEFGPGQPYGPGLMPPFLHMFTNVLPLFRRLGLEESAIRTMLVDNPARILPIG
jgi:phosphotriesterase-related protein